MQEEDYTYFNHSHAVPAEVIFAKALAVAQQHDDVRYFLLNEAKEQPFGEYLIFWIMVKDEVVYGTQTFAELLANSLADSSYSVRWFEEDLVDLMPRLGIYFYTAGDDIENITLSSPIKVTASYSDMADTALHVTYDETLHTGVVDMVNEDPNQYLFVVEDVHYVIYFNERIHDNTDLEFAILSGGGGILDMCTDLLDILEQFIIEHGGLIVIITTDELFIEWSPLYNYYVEMCLDVVDDNTDTGDDCDRDEFDCRELTTAVQLNSLQVLRKFCKSWRTYCELRVTSIAVSDAENPVLDQITKSISVLRDDLKSTGGVYIDPPVKMLYWDMVEEGMADRMKYKWIGKRPMAGTEISGTLGITGNVKFKVDLAEVTVGVNVSTTVKYTIKDYDFGDELVFYCDPFNQNINSIMSKEYDTGTDFSFWIGLSENQCL